MRPSYAKQNPHNRRHAIAGQLRGTKAALIGLYARCLGTPAFYRAAALAAILCLFTPHQALATVTQDGNGWTQVSLPAGDQAYYVSTSGSDSNDGLSSGAPKQTIAAAMALMTNDSGDHILLKRGDSFTISASIVLRGRSASEPMLLGAYGTGARPRIDGGDVLPVNCFKQSYIYIIGVHFESTRTDGSSIDGLSFFDGVGGDLAGNILVEDCFVKGYQKNVRFDADPGYSVPNITVRRNIIVDSWSKVAHSQGLFCDHVDGLLVEENVFDHNGWIEGAVGAENGAATVFNHNMYLSWDVRNVTVRNNISSRASSHGLKCQPSDGPMVVTDNIFVRCGSAGQYGASDDAGGHTPLGMVVTIEDNCYLEGYLTGAANNYGLGLTLQNIESGTFNRNIIANRVTDGAHPSTMYSLDLEDNPSDTSYGIHNLQIDGHITYDWRGPALIRDYTTFDHSGIVLTDCAFYDPNSGGGRLLEITDTSSSVNSFTAGHYHTSETSDRWFAIGPWLSPVSKSYAEWIAATNDTGSVEITSITGSFTDNTITMSSSAHDIHTGDPVSMTWAGGYRYGMTAGTVSGASVPVTGGFGTAVPTNGTTLTRVVPFFDPTRTLLTYGTSQLSVADYDATLAHFRNRAIGDTAIIDEIDTARNWIRAGFNLAAETTSPQVLVLQTASGYYGIGVTP